MEKSLFNDFNPVETETLPKFIDLDAFVPQDSLTVKINGVTYKVVEPDTELYLMILNLSVIEDPEKAKENFFNIFHRAAPDIPEDIIRGMRGQQVQNFFKFLVIQFAALSMDPNAQRPMMK